MPSLSPPRRRCSRCRHATPGDVISWIGLYKRGIAYGEPWPIEDVMRTMKALKEEGKIRFAGLSECTPAELRRAHAVFPVTAIQVEYSLQARVAVES